MEIPPSLWHSRALLLLTTVTELKPCIRFVCLINITFLNAHVKSLLNTFFDLI